MSQVLCTICGAPTTAHDSGEVAVSLDAAPSAESSVVCASCSSKLSAEVAKGGTSVIAPTDSEIVTRELLAPPPETPPIGSSAFKIESKDAKGSTLGAQPKKVMSLPEFDFARKRRFGSYEILGEISRGSFGVVYKARQAGLDRIVALKVLLDGVHASPEAIERFQREARSVARMKHKCIVPIYDIGTCDGHYYFAMEFIEGHPLSTHILARELTISHALAIAEDAADAMECAHRAGVIHRDIKPSNILIDNDGEPHITDFGLAKQVDLENKYTVSGTTLGTPAYMPPEQARGQLAKIDARSDVYALGTVLYEMLTGTTPFAGRSLLEVVVAVINEPVPPPRSINPKIHRDIQTIVMKCLEKDQGQRYATAAELRDDLRRFRSGEAILAKPAGVVSRALRYAKRHKYYIASAACVAIAFLITMAAIAGLHNKEAIAKKTEEETKKKLEQEKKKSEEEWISAWAFDPRDGRAGMPQATENMYSRQGRISKAELLASPEKDRFFGDFKARIRVELTSDEAAAKGFSIGMQSFSSGKDSIPYLLELRNQSAQVVGPQDMEAFRMDLDRSKDTAVPRFEVKLEKSIQPLRKGVYDLGIERIDGTRLIFSVQYVSPPGVSPDYGPLTQEASRAAWGPFKAEIQDYNLSHWMIKYAQIVIPRPPATLALISGEVQRKIGNKPGTLVRALNNFRIGEYSAAAGDFKLLKDSNDGLAAARAEYYLGLIDEICKQTPLDALLNQYHQASYNLLQMRAAETKEESYERASLMREIRMRVIVCYAKKAAQSRDPSDWAAMRRELEQGWMSGTRVGEALGWELQGVLELAAQAAVDSRNLAIADTILSILSRTGLDPSADRLANCAQLLGERFLAQPGDTALRDICVDKLKQLRTLVPTAKLDTAFAMAAREALKVKPEKALDILLALPRDAASRSPVVNDSTVQTVLGLARVRNHSDVYQLLEYFGSKRAIVEYLNELTLDILPAEPLDNLFYSRIFQSISSLAPFDARQALEGAAERLAKPLSLKGRSDKLIAVHKALRKGTNFDPRLTPYFATALENLPNDDDESALRLLEYAYAHVTRDDPGLVKASTEFAQRRSSDPPETFGKLVVRIEEKFPPADVANFARDVIHKLSQNREYAKAVDFFKEARTRFISDGPALLPDVVAALENIEPAERDKALENVLTSVSDELKKLEDESPLRMWQLEYGDLLLALSRWDGARKQYQTLLGYVELDPPAAARAALRLISMKLARPEAQSTNSLIIVATSAGAPEEIKLAAQLLAAQGQFSYSSLSMEDFKEKLKTVENHELGVTEIQLVCGLRMRMDGDETGAQHFFKQAFEQAQPERLWTAAVASELLRPSRKVVEKETIDTAQ